VKNKQEFTNTTLYTLCIKVFI